MDELIFLAVGGFLLGATLYSGFYTTRYEPEVKTGYIVMGLGIVASVAVNTWVMFVRDVSDWFRVGTFIGYAMVALGLVLIVRARRRAHPGAGGQ